MYRLYIGYQRSVAYMYYVGFLTAHVTVVYSFSIDNKMSGNMIVMYEVPAVYLEIIDSFVYMLCDVHEVRNKYYLHFRLVQISFCRLFKCKEG